MTAVSPAGGGAEAPPSVTRIGVILGSTRPGRPGEPVAHSVMDPAGRRSDAEFELVDLTDYPLPHLDEPLPASTGQYQNAHIQEWAATIGRFDGFVFVTRSTTLRHQAS